MIDDAGAGHRRHHLVETPCVLRLQSSATSVGTGIASLWEYELKLIFIHGASAVGKLTIARELQAQTGLRLFHNHLVVDSLLAVFPFGSASFVRLRERFWLDVFAEAVRDDVSMIFTFTPESTVRIGFAKEVEVTVNCRGGRVHFIELLCPLEEQERRIELPSRAEFHKLRSVETYRILKKKRPIHPNARPRADLQIDTSKHTPAESARLIIEAFNLPTPGNAEYDAYPLPK